MSRKYLKYVIRVLLTVILLPVGYALTSFVFSIIPINRDFIQAEDGIDIFVWSNGVHTDFVVPIRTAEIDWSMYFPFDHFRRAYPSATHISFGWGDRKFYMETPTWADLKWSTAFDALFLLGESAMHVTYIYDPEANSQCKRIVLSPNQYGALVKYIIASFQKSYSEKVLLIPDRGYSTNDAFYEANGSFSFLKTCNEWTGRGLRRIGVKVGIWTPFAEGVMYYL